MQCVIYIVHVPLFIGPSAHVSIFERTLFKWRAEAIFDSDVIQCNVSLVILATNSLKNNLDTEINHSLDLKKERLFFLLRPLSIGFSFLPCCEAYIQLLHTDRC